MSTGNLKQAAAIVNRTPSGIVRAARRTFGRGTVEWLSGYVGAVLRVTVRAGVELSCVPSELEILKPWTLAGGGEDLPVAEYTRPPWSRRSYRWTHAAHHAAIELEAANKARRRSRIA